MRFNLKFLSSVVFAVTFLVGGFFVANYTTHAAGPWYVTTTGSDTSDCLSVNTACLTIQAAVDKATSGDTINVAAGTYYETQVRISKALTLSGAGAGLTIIDAQQNQPPDEGIVRINSGTGGPVLIQGFTFQNPGVDLRYGYRVDVAAYYTDAPVTVQNSRFVGISGLEAIGFYVFQNHGANAKAIVTNSEFDTLSVGVMGEMTKAAVEVSENNFHNLVTFVDSGNTYTPMAVEFYDESGTLNNQLLQISGNTMHAYAGRGIQFYAYSGAKYTNVEITDNEITSVGDSADTQAGIRLYNDGTGTDNGVYNAMISANTITGVGGTASKGIWLMGPNNNITVQNNFISNTGTGVLTTSDSAEYATGLVVHNNSLTGNTAGVNNGSTLSENVIDATNNWWGSVSGPSGLGSGTGDTVSTNVTFIPWYTNPEMTTKNIVPFSFVEYTGNPIWGGSIAANKAYSPYVIKIGAVYNMWYGDGVNARYISSTNPDFSGATFPGTIVTGTTASQPYKFTVYYNSDGWTLGGHDYAQKLVAYYGEGGGGSNLKVAVSDDGINWTFVSSISGVTAGPGAAATYRMSVLYEGNNTWKGWADSVSSEGSIRYFTSTDGINWTFVARNILPVYQSWENSVWYEISPYVFKMGDTYVMTYSAGLTNNNQGIGIAYSTDGQNWTKDVNNPVFSIADNVAWRSFRTYNSYIMNDNGLWRMYFQGNDATNYSIGMATSGTVVPPEVTLSSIEITTPATKLSYTVGDELDISGLVVTGTYSDASHQVVTPDSVTGFDSSVAVASQTLTVNYGGTTTTYTVVITTNTVSHGNSGSRPATPAVPANVTTPDGCAPGNKFSTTTGRNCNAATPAVPAGQVLGASTQVGQVLGAEKFNFTKFLKFKTGSYKVSLQGPEVIELQKFLATLGYDLGIADGKFGPKTEGAVIKFQIANGLKGDGVVGPLTRAMLNKSR